MVLHTVSGFPYVEPADTVTAYPVTSQELANALETTSPVLLTTAGLAVSLDTTDRTVAGPLAISAAPRVRTVLIAYMSRLGTASTGALSITYTLRDGATGLAVPIQYFPANQGGTMTVTWAYALPANVAASITATAQAAATGAGTTSAGDRHRLSVIVL